jgi:hypothetical protein
MALLKLNVIVLAAINHNGTGSGNSVTIILKNVAYTTDLLTNLIANGNLVLETVKPTLV